MADTQIFVFDRDWDADIALIDQASKLVTIRLEDGLHLADLLPAALQGAMGLPQDTIAWLWYNALAITIQELMEEPKAKL
ncbi:hypothetical protein F4776DRAFT_191830 [Hypoxylon sp. NC0597]|nr:hypothetical protein F4776DRAFT_191830 [Hypoxylon sp. NC0597]